jgi:hypothetical protein
MGSSNTPVANYIKVILTRKNPDSKITNDIYSVWATLESLNRDYQLKYTADPIYDMPASFINKQPPLGKRINLKGHAYHDEIGNILNIVNHKDYPYINLCINLPENYQRSADPAIINNPAFDKDNDGKYTVIKYSDQNLGANGLNYNIELLEYEEEVYDKYRPIKEFDPAPMKPIPPPPPEKQILPPPPPLDNTDRGWLKVHCGNLGIGDPRSNCVKKLQTMLKKHGYYVSSPSGRGFRVDGIYDEWTAWGLKNRMRNKGTTGGAYSNYYNHYRQPSGHGGGALAGAVVYDTFTT